METNTGSQRSNNSRLISVARSDTIRLLEVYVKRSLSLNDGTMVEKHTEREEKWVMKRQRRHSSDPSLHLAEDLDTREAGKPSVDEPEPHLNQSKTRPKGLEKLTKKSKNNKKPTFWKLITGFFSRKSNEDSTDEQDSPSETPKNITEDEDSDAVTTCLPTTPVTSQKKTVKRKSLRKKLSKRRLIRPNKPVKDLGADEITEIEAVVSVQPTDLYYEKVSEELEKIVYEVKVKEEEPPLTDEEVINRIIALIKKQGDAIDDKLRDNPTLSNFFQQLPYSSFQRLVDSYVEKKASPIHNPPTVPPTAPELVKLAFTLDFTARIAGLSRSNIAHITCLGNRYLKDRFQYNQACTDHPWSDSDD
ncbi:uncharacterized protein LOC115043976 [Echeneis naucrates]|uniref:uncharacterized protein LOC115043976 n=1 Tax=Echeneis naucrates TaxID=173247 RepID=UPI0011143CFC|nr:uncharacterized protein LOC115043976 [Echeneis naucrates]